MSSMFSSPRSSILVIGNCYVDETLILPRFPREDEKLTIKEIISTLGGSATNTAIALANLKQPVSLFSVVGTDPAANFILRTLQTHPLLNIEHVVQENGESGKTIILLTPSGQSTKLGYPGVSASLPLHIKQKDESFFQQFTHIHLASVSTDLLTLLLRIPNLSLSLDIGAPTLTSSPRQLYSLFNSLSLIFMNRSAFSRVFKEDISLSSLEALPSWNLVVTAGKDGIFAKIHETTYHQPAYPVSQIKDTTGAGDAVAATLLSEMLRSSSPPSPISSSNNDSSQAPRNSSLRLNNVSLALQRAAYAAAHKIQFLGGSNGHITLRSLLSAIPSATRTASA